MIEVFVAFLLCFLFIGAELAGRKRCGFSPATPGELLRLVALKTDSKGAPNSQNVERRRQQRILLFVVFCSLTFGIWESLIWYLYGREFDAFAWLRFFVGFAMVLGASFLRYKVFFSSSKPLHSTISLLQWGLFLGGLGLLLGSWYSLALFTPWIYFRVRRQIINSGRVIQN